MSVVTYTAKRMIEPTGFRKVGSDLSVAAADDSFNSAVINLLGVANGDWFKVSGFANGANNGWFLANAASTANKITQGTATALVTEAAGPNVTIVGYRRGYAQSYQIEFGCRKLEPSRQIKRHDHVAVGGNSRSVLHRIDSLWDVETGRLLESQMPQWDEFFASVAAGETFTFDAYGTIGTPDDPRAAKLVGSDWRHGRLGATRRYTTSFQLRLA